MPRCCLRSVVLWILLLLAVSVSAQTVTQPQQDVSTLQREEISSKQDYILITTVAGFLTTILTLLINSWRAERDRKAERKAQEDERNDEREALERKRQADKEDAERQRQWDLEDRRLARQAATEELRSQTAELKRIAQLEAELTRARAQQIEAELKAESARAERSLHTSQQVVLDKIAEGTEASKEAQKEANEMNKKLAAMHAAIDGVRPRGARRATDDVQNRQLRDIQHTVEETHDDIRHDAKPVIDETLEKVRRIDEATADGDSQNGQHAEQK